MARRSWSNPKSIIILIHPHNQRSFAFGGEFQASERACMTSPHTHHVVVCISTVYFFFPRKSRQETRYSFNLGSASKLRVECTRTQYATYPQAATMAETEQKTSRIVSPPSFLLVCALRLQRGKKTGRQTIQQRSPDTERGIFAS